MPVISLEVGIDLVDVEEVAEALRRQGERYLRRIYTDVAVVEVTPAGFVVREVIDGLDQTELQARSGAPLTFANDCRPLVAPSLADAE